MSYAVATKPKARKVKAEDDDENASNPLLAVNVKRQTKVIETKLQTLQQKVKLLGDLCAQIGSDVDNPKFRHKIQQDLAQTGALMKTCGNEIEEFRELKTAAEETKTKLDQYTAFKTNRGQQMKKLQEIGQRIKEKQIQHADKAIQLARESMAEMTEDGKQHSNPEDFMVDGQVRNFSLNDPEAAPSAPALSLDQIQVSNEADFMAAVIDQRKEDINAIGDIMANINEMAGAIAKETTEQGEKLARLDDNMTAADENVADGVKELKQAAVHQKKAGRCMYFLVGVIFVCIIILGIILFS